VRGRDRVISVIMTAYVIWYRSSRCPIATSTRPLSDWRAAVLFLTITAHPKGSRATGRTGPGPSCRGGQCLFRSQLAILRDAHRRRHPHIAVRDRHERGHDAGRHRGQPARGRVGLTGLRWWLSSTLLRPVYRWRARPRSDEPRLLCAPHHRFRGQPVRRDVEVAATYGFLFVLFGSIYQRAGGGQFFFELAAVLVGASRAAPPRLRDLLRHLRLGVGQPDCRCHDHRRSPSRSCGGTAPPRSARRRPRQPPPAAARSCRGDGSVAFLMVEYTGIPIARSRWRHSASAFSTISASC